jgi:hypothetical protein
VIHTCPDCDLSLTRTAVMVLVVRKLLAEVHAGHRHPGDYGTCTRPPCVQVVALIDQGGLKCSTTDLLKWLKDTYSKPEGFGSLAS